MSYETGESFHIVMLESYAGKDTLVFVGDDEQDYLYFVVAIDENGGARIADGSYRTESEALEAWPEAKASQQDCRPSNPPRSDGGDRTVWDWILNPHQPPY